VNLNPIEDFEAISNNKPIRLEDKFLMVTFNQGMNGKGCGRPARHRGGKIFFANASANMTNILNDRTPSLYTLHCSK
jgi:hypothetical protein